MKSVLLSEIEADEDLMAKVPADRWMERGSVSDTPTTPFVVIAGAGRTTGLSTYRVGTIEFWVHDERGTYENVDSIITGIIRVLDGLQQRKDALYDVLSVEYQSDSPDLEDDGYRTNTRSVTFRVVGRAR